MTMKIFKNKVKCKIHVLVDKTCQSIRIEMRLATLNQLEGL